MGRPDPAKIADIYKAGKGIGKISQELKISAPEIKKILKEQGVPLRINRQFIGHDYYTDHIGFDNCQGNLLAGDTYISLDTVRTNSELFGTDYEEELHRVIIHSILHLCGIDDQTEEERQEMEEAENMALAMR